MSEQPIAVTVNAEDFGRVVQAVDASAARDDASILGGIHLRIDGARLEAASTNAFHLSLAGCECSALAVPQQTVLRRKSLLRVADHCAKRSGEQVAIVPGAQYWVFHEALDHRWLMSVPVLPGWEHYPDIGQVMPDAEALTEVFILDPLFVRKLFASAPKGCLNQAIFRCAGKRGSGVMIDVQECGGEHRVTHYVMPQMGRPSAWAEGDPIVWKDDEGIVTLDTAAADPDTADGAK